MTNDLKLTAEEWRYLAEKHSADPEPVAFPSPAELDYLAALRVAAEAKGGATSGNGRFDMDSIKPGMSNEDIARAIEAIVATGWK